MIRRHNLQSLLVWALAISGSTLADVSLNKSEPVTGSKSIPGVESSEQRASIPMYEVIPPVPDSELTPASTVNIPEDGWSRSNGDEANTRYSPLSQINRKSVSALEVAWIYRSRDGVGNIQANPVVVDGVIYAPTVGHHIVAIDGRTGIEKWRTLPFGSASDRQAQPLSPDASAPSEPTVTGFGPAQRGLVYWRGDRQHSARIYFVANGYLIALDAATGRRVTEFGDRGQVPSTKGAGLSSFLGTPAPSIYGHIIIAANQNLIDAFDLVTGARLWHFDTLNYPVSLQQEDNGGNVWGGMALDAARGIVFLATGDPHPNFVGVGRQGRNDRTCSVIALDVSTGRLLWVFQEVAHNLWDLDVPAPPNLVSIWHHGKRVDAVAQVTKLGNTLLLDRLSGRPLFPYRLRRAPASTVPGERTWPYQPDLELPRPFARQVFTLDDVTDISPESHAFVLKKVQNAVLGWFEPPHVGKPTVFFGIHGGAEWPGASFDPATGWLYVSSNEIPWIESLSISTQSQSKQISLPSTPGQAVYDRHCAVCHGKNRQGQGMAPSLAGLGHRLTESQVVSILTMGRNSMPAIALARDERRELLNSLFDREVVFSKTKLTSETESTPTYEASGFDKLLDDHDYPGSKPPWGTLNAIDLNTGRLAWKVPLGEYEELTQRGIPRTGTENFGGPMVTGGDLVFCAGTRDLNIRAFDKTTGAELWHHKLPYGGYAPPATYSIGGRQYVLIAATGGGKLGGKLGDTYVAFALPISRERTGTQ